MGEESIEAFHARLDGAAISTYVLVMIIVPMKTLGRMRSGNRSLGVDDILTAFTLLLANAFFWICMIGMRKSLGHHVGIDVTIPEAIDFLRYVFAAQLVYCFAIAFIKFSILSLYWKLFSTAARIPIIAVSFVAFAWLMVLTFLVIFTCNPVEAQWNILITDKTCIPLRGVYLGGSLPNVVTDIVLVSMPLPHVWRLHAPLAQRIALVGMFALGAFICVVSIVRLTIMMGIPLADPDITYNMKEVIVWSIVEINIGLVCACLPSMRPALRLVGLNRMFSTGRGSTNDTPGASHATPVNRIEDAPRKGRKKGSTGGLFSTLAGLTKLDSEEDAFQMIDNAAALHGKSNAQVQVGRVSDESENGSRGTTRTKQDGINVQRDWSVFVNQRDEPR